MFACAGLAEEGRPATLETQAKKALFVESSSEEETSESGSSTVIENAATDEALIVEGTGSIFLAGLKVDIPYFLGGISRIKFSHV